MLMVPTKVQPSGIHGLGLFALEPIAKGTLVWQYVHGFDVCVSAFDHKPLVRQVQPLPKVASDFLEKYAYKNEAGEYEVCVDDARFMNHSTDPNICAQGDKNHAIRDIAPGEEIVCDYGDFIPGFVKENFND